LSLFNRKKESGIHGLLLSWLVSYGVILLLAFLFILSAYFLLSRNLRDESFRVHEATVQQSQISMDYLLSEISMITEEVNLMPEVVSLGGFSGELGSRQYYLKNQLRDELYKLHRSHPAIETLFVYFREGDYIVSSIAAYDPEYYFETQYPQASISNKGWRNLLFQDSYGDTFSLMQLGNGDESEPYIQFVTTRMSWEGKNSSRISICLTVKESTIARLIDGGVRGGRFFIMDGPSEVFLKGDEPIPENLPAYRELWKNSEKAIVWEDQILSVFPSHVNDWLFVSLSSQTIVESRLNQIRWVIMGLVVFFWVIGTLIALFFARRNYLPITRLMEYVSGDITQDNVTHFRREEYRYIEESFNRLREEKASIQDQLTLQQETLRTNFLSRLLTGKLKESSHTLEEQCQFQGFYFEENTFVTVILKMEGTVLNDDQLTQEKGAQWLASQIQFLLSDFYYGVGWVCDINNLSVLFLNLQSPTDDPQMILQAFLGDLKEKILKETGITYTIGASSFKDAVSAVPLSYEEAQEALDYRMIKGKGAVITYYDIMAQEKGKRVFNSLNWERRFINLFTSGSYEEAGALMQSALDKLSTVHSLSVMKIRLFGFMNILIDALGDYFDEAFLDDLGCENRLLACTTLQETRLEMEKLFNEIQKYSRNQQDTSLKEKVTEIMEEYYKDPNLSVGFLADQLELSISNFSWLFKEETGIGPLDCIHRIRLREAKIQLGKTDLTVKEIARECGYLSDIAFIRVFKKYEGITPGQYRNEQKKQFSLA
jgi:two-component system response regulator YesN